MIPISPSSSTNDLQEDYQGEESHQDIAEDEELYAAAERIQIQFTLDDENSGKRAPPDESQPDNSSM